MHVLTDLYLFCFKFLDADLRKKLVHAKEICDLTKETLKDFNVQKMQLQNFINQTEDWLIKTEESLLSCANSQDPSTLNTVKVGTKSVNFIFHFTLL